MTRHDPLSCLAPLTEAAPALASEPASKPSKARSNRRLPPLLRELAAVADDTLAFLYGGPDQQPGDYERNKSRAADIRADFTAFCEQNPRFSNWRQAWATFMASRPQPARVPITFQPEPCQRVPVIPAPVQTPAPPTAPLWQQRARLRAVRVLNYET
jgi:hypothetical protein